MCSKFESYQLSANDKGGLDSQALLWEVWVDMLSLWLEVNRLAYFPDHPGLFVASRIHHPLWRHYHVLQDVCQHHLKDFWIWRFKSVCGDCLTVKAPMCQHFETTSVKKCSRCTCSDKAPLPPYHIQPHGILPNALKNSIHYKTCFYLQIWVYAWTSSPIRVKYSSKNVSNLFVRRNLFIYFAVYSWTVNNKLSLTWHLPFGHAHYHGYGFGNGQGP